jgi:hydrogenase nickel incorporation protein HypA/HybF
MHERSLVRAMLANIEDLMQQQGGGQVIAINVSVGDFSGVELDLLRIAFDDLAWSTCARGALLNVQRVSLEARCLDCYYEFHVQRFRFECPQCGHRDIKVVRGEGLMLESVTMEQVSQ